MKYLILAAAILALVVSVVYSQATFVGQAEVRSATQFGPGIYSATLDDGVNPPFDATVEVLSVVTPTPPPTATPTPTPPPPNPCPDVCYDIAWYCNGGNPQACTGLDPERYNVQIDDINRSFDPPFGFHDSDALVVFDTSDNTVGVHTVTVLDEFGAPLPEGTYNTGVIPQGTTVSLSVADLETEALRQGVDSLRVICLLHSTMPEISLEVFNGGPGYF